MGNNVATVSKRFEIECRPLDATREPNYLPTTATVPAEPTSDVNARLEAQARKIAASIRLSKEFQPCTYRQFLSDAQQVLASTKPSEKVGPEVFAPKQDGQIYKKVTWTETRRIGNTTDAWNQTTTLKIPSIPHEDPLDTARRLVREVREKGSPTIKWSLSRPDFQFAASDLNPQEAKLVQEAVKLEEVVAAQLEAEAQQRAERLHERDEGKYHPRWSSFKQ